MSPPWSNGPYPNSHVMSMPLLDSSTFAEASFRVEQNQTSDNGLHKQEYPFYVIHRLPEII
jgi:hypothetical protein